MPRTSLALKSMPATASTIRTAATISGLPQIVELNIGHYLMGEAIFVGLGESVRRMRASMDGARAALRQSDTAAAMSGGA